MTPPQDSPPLFDLTPGLAALVERSSADSVELKVLVDGAADEVARVLGGPLPPAWRHRLLHLLDTPSLELSRTGTLVRLRRRGSDLLDVSARSRRPLTLPSADRPQRARVELDIVPGDAWETVELQADVSPEAAERVVVEGVDASVLLTDEQRDWAAASAYGRSDVRLPAPLQAHGPIRVRRLSLSVPAGYTLRQLRLEWCRFPSGRTLLELSSRGTPGEASAMTAAFTGLVARSGLTVSPVQQTKTSALRDELARP